MASNQQRKYANYKRIILAADGTWLGSDLGNNATPSNIAKIARAISPLGVGRNGDIVQQVVQYQAGLAASALPIEKAIEGGLGIGIDAEVCQMYDFIANNYEPQDELFFFGFSRGAFTVRSVVGLISDVGILPAVRMNEFASMWKAYREHTDGTPFRDSHWYQKYGHDLLHNAMPPRIKVCGVFDTVGSLGVPEWLLVRASKSVGIDVNRRNKFYNLKLPSTLENAFHALALDEKRLVFPPTLWVKPREDPETVHTQNLEKPVHDQKLKQTWFPGSHQNIGGQYEPGRSDHQEIGYNTLAWMIDNLSGLLTFCDAAIEALVTEHRSAIDQNSIPQHSWSTFIHQSIAERLNYSTDYLNKSGGWGSGDIVDSFKNIWLGGPVFWLLGEQCRMPGSYASSSEVVTHEYVHPIVRIRRENRRDWLPAFLKHFYPLRRDGEGAGWKWLNQETGLTLPEDVLRDSKMSVRIGANGSTEFGEKMSMSRMLCPVEIWSQLEADNSHVSQ